MKIYIGWCNTKNCSGMMQFQKTKDNLVCKKCGNNLVDVEVYEK